jgi:hypothetical protein
MMSDDNAVDLVRWTFTVESDKTQVVEAYLTDLGADVYARAEGHFVVLWDEPESDLDAVVEELWEVIGSTIEVTHETFNRNELVIYHQDGDGETDAEGDRSAA